MNPFIVMARIFGFSLLLLASISSAYEAGDYAKPVYTGQYVSDIQSLYRKALTEKTWQYELTEDGRHLGSISHRKMQAQVELIRTDNGIQIELISSSSGKSCKEDCSQNGTLLRWLSYLRQQIAYEVTLLAVDYWKSEATGSNN